MVLDSPAELPGSRAMEWFPPGGALNGTRPHSRHPMLGASTQSPTANSRVSALTLLPAPGPQARIDAWSEHG